MTQLQVIYAITFLQALLTAVVGVQLFRMRDSIRRGDGSISDIPTGLALGAAAASIALAAIGALVQYAADKRHNDARDEFESESRKSQSETIRLSKLVLELQSTLGGQQQQLAAADEARGRRIHRQNKALTIVTSVHEHDISIWKITNLLRTGVILSASKITCLVGEDPAAQSEPRKDVSKETLELCEYLTTNRLRLEELLDKQEQSMAALTAGVVSLTSDLRAALRDLEVLVDSTAKQVHEDELTSSVRSAEIRGELLRCIGALSAAAIADSSRAIEQVLVWGNSD